MQTAQPERVRALEPRPDRAANADPLLMDLVDKGQQRLVIQSILCPLLIAMGVFDYSVNADRVVIPVFLVVMFTFLWFFWLRMYFRAFRPLKKLLDGAFRELWPGQGGILAAESKVSLRVPGDGDAQWLVVRLHPAQRVQLAGQRRLWVLGPGRSGYAYVVLPGSLVGVIGRLRAEPAPGSVELPVESREPTPPNADPVLLARLGWLRKAQYRGVVAFAVMAVGFGLIAAAVGFSSSEDDDSIVTVTITVAVMLALGALFILRFARKAGKPPAETHWTELIAVVDGGISTTAGGIANAVGRATLPDGSQVLLRLIKVDVNLVANVAATGRLWVLGPPKVGEKIKIGLPGYPFFGSARLGA
jgi:hypothetical protein